MSHDASPPAAGTAPAPTLPQLIAPAIKALASRIEQAASRVVTMSDDEAIHDFRVAIRRLRSVLATTRSLYEPKQVKALSKQLKRFADGCGALRDEEVLSETLARVVLDAATREKLSRWLGGRKSLESDMKREAAHLASSTDLRECLLAITKATAPEASRPKATPTLGSFCREQLDVAAARIEGLLPAKASDSEGLHRLRIAFKRQRYSAETLINLMGKRAPEDPLAADLDDATTAARSAKVMQQQLGIVHDIDQAMLTLRAAEAIDMTAHM